jgi:hypothetical protein
MSDELSKALIELRRRIRDIPIQEAVREVSKRYTNPIVAQEVHFINTIIDIYREAIFERMDAVQRDFE